MTFYLRCRLTLVLVLFGVLWVPIVAQGQVRQLAGYITDQAAALSAQDSHRLAQMLAFYERETSHQIAVPTGPSLSGEPINTFSLRVEKS